MKGGLNQIAHTFTAVEKASGRRVKLSIWLNTKTDYYELRAWYDGPDSGEEIKEWEFSWPDRKFLMKMVTDNFEIG